MCFSEYLAAHQQNVLLESLNEWLPAKEFSPTLHSQAQLWFHRFAMTGGMPATIALDSSGADIIACHEQQLDLTATYRADFAKYSGRIDPSVLDSILRTTALSLGRKFVYANAEDGIKTQTAKKAIDLLCSAKVCHKVRYSYGNGLPLGAETKDTFRKIILNDIGLFNALLRFPIQTTQPGLKNIAPAVRGQIMEQLAGQLLRQLGPFSGDGPELYYWQREGGRPGEIDYLLQIFGKIIPVELKAGTSGAMKSLHQFMYDKKLDLAVRFDENPPSNFMVETITTQSNPVKYRLISLPLYLAEKLDKIIASIN
jgi:predicted AAA+ superfamily ATPase